MVKYLHYMPSANRQQQALNRLLEVVVFLGNDMTESLARDGLTGARAHVLWELQRSGPTTQRALADAMNVSARNVTGLVDGLVATGFVTREPHPTDRRATWVTFTDRGAATARQLQAGQQELAGQLFAEMPDKQLDCFLAGLDEVLTRLAAAAHAASAVSTSRG